MKDSIKVRKYRHLTRDDRVKIEVLFGQKYSVGKISKELGFSRQTIYSELKRGLCDQMKSDLTTYNKYSCDKAQLDAELKASHKGKQLKIGSDWEFVHFLQKRIIDDRFSPEAVIGELKRDGNPFSTSICVKTLYNYIHRGLIPGVEIKDLPYKVKRKKKGKLIRDRKKLLHRNAKSIEQREDLSKRSEFGHWEMDSVVGPARKSKKALLVMTERKTRKELIRLLDNHTAAAVTNALRDIRRDYKGIIKTITVDNGTEFSDVDGLINSDPDDLIQLFFCHPYSSWERGSNENNNKLIRRWIPKGVSFDKLDEEDIQKIEDWVNHYPRGMFEYRTSEMLWAEEMQRLSSSA